jgi:hypothetical protein
MDPLLDPGAEPGEQSCFQSCSILDCAIILMKLTITAAENIAAMTRPMTTRGMGASSSRSTNAMVRVVHRSRALAKNIKNTSPPLVVHGRRIRQAMTVTPSKMVIKIICTSPLPFANEMQIALQKEAITGRIK